MLFYFSFDGSFCSVHYIETHAYTHKETELILLTFYGIWILSFSSLQDYVLFERLHGFNVTFRSLIIWGFFLCEV